MKEIFKFESKDGTPFILIEKEGIFIIENIFTAGACFHFESLLVALEMAACIEKSIEAI